MIKILVFYELIVFSIIFNLLALIKIVRGKHSKIVIYLAINIIIAILAYREINILGLVLAKWATSMICIGILNFFVELYFGNDFYEYISVFLITLVLGTIFYICGISIVNDFIFKDIPLNLENHYCKVETKHHAKKLDTTKELTEILNILNEKNIPISKETINNEIDLKDYRKYNGIYCYFFEEYEDHYEIGMTIGENNYFFQDKDFLKPFNYIVNKNDNTLTLKN